MRAKPRPGRGLSRGLSAQKRGKSCDNNAAGGLMSYGASLSAAYRLMASYVAHIFKGAKLADLPVQQSTTLEMVVNLKAAKALDITIPTGILLRADGTIE
jgi:putative ABC transport system substrate-binding protein